MKHRWIGKVGPEAIPADELATLAQLVLPGVDPAELQPMTGGFRNWNYKADTSAGPLVLRIYGPCDRCAWKEQRLAELVAPEVATPKFLDIQDANERVVALREFVPGTVLHELFQTPIALGPDIALVVGRTLANIHRIEFEACGDLDAALRITESYDTSGAGVLDYVRSTLEAGAGERLGASLAKSVLVMLEACASSLDAWPARPVLVHGDFGPTNLVLARDGSVSVLDWEFGCSAFPALDFGNLLRPPLEENDAFAHGLAAGYRAAGGRLPPNWQRLAVIADVMAWVSFAARPSLHEIVLADARERLQHAIHEFSSESSRA